MRGTENPKSQDRSGYKAVLLWPSRELVGPHIHSEPLCSVLNEDLAR